MKIMKTNLKRVTQTGLRAIAGAAIIPAMVLISCEKEEIGVNEDTSTNTELKLSSNSVNLSISNVAASTEQSDNPASSAVDGNTSTRWSGYGTSVTFDITLSSSALIDYLKIAFYSGDERTNSFQVYTRATTSDSFDLVGTKTSSGSTEGYETFDVTNSTGQYIRLICKGNSVNDWNSILEVDVYGTGDEDEGGGTTDGTYPADVLGITSNTWKINSFVGTPSNDPDYYDDITDASGVSFDTYTDDYYYYTDGEWVFFKCYRGLGGSSNSDNPRVELRELDGSGNVEYWTNEGTNTMEWTVRCDQLSNDDDNEYGVTCVGQIHGPGSSVDDIIRVQFYGDAGQSSGSVKIKISGYITEDVLGGSQFLSATYSLDTEYTMKLAYNSDDYVTLYIDGSNVFSQKMDTDKDDNYFKVGNYVQQSSGASYDGSYAIVAIKDLTIVHN